MELVKKFCTYLREAYSFFWKDNQGSANEGGSRNLTRSSGLQSTDSEKNKSLFICSILIACAVGTAQAAEEVKIKGQLGGSATLPCRMEGGDINKLSVLWQTKEQDMVAFYFRNGTTQEQTVNQRFLHRTHMSIAGIRSGNLSLNIEQLQLNDSGKYKCIIMQKGSTPDIHIVTLIVMEPDAKMEPIHPLEVTTNNSSLNNTDVRSSISNNQHFGLIFSGIAVFVICSITCWMCCKKTCWRGNPVAE